MELKSRNFTSKEPHVVREPQVADPWSRATGEHFFFIKKGPNNTSNMWLCII